MGVDIATYRGRIGCFKGSLGCDVVTVQCNVNFSSGMKTIGVVVFIGLLLIIGGIEPNPGPTRQKETNQRSLKETIQNIAEDLFMIWIVVTVAALLYYILDFNVFLILWLLCLAAICFLNRNDPSKENDSKKEKETDSPDDSDIASNQGILFEKISVMDRISNTTAKELRNLETTITHRRISPDKNADSFEDSTNQYVIDTTHSNKKGEDVSIKVTSLTDVAARTPESAPTADRPIEEDSAKDCFLNDLLQRLGLSDKYPEKITSNEIVCVDITSPSEDQAYSMNHAPYILLKKIISVNCDARDTVSNGSESCNSEQHECPDDTDNFVNDIDHFERHSSSFSPLDIFHIVLACCDPILKQNLYRKLYLCKMALPFITKFNALQSSRLEIWPLRTLYVFDSDKKREENVLKVQSHFLGFARLGRPAFSKSRLLNCLLSGESNAFQTFYNNECPSGMIDHTATQGLVESFWLQTNAKTSISSKTVTFFNMRGELKESFDDESRMFIQTTCQCLVLIPDLNGIETRLAVITEYLLKFKHVIFVFPSQTTPSTRKLIHEFQIMASSAGTDIFAVNTQGGANFFDIVCSLAKRLKSILNQYSVDSLENKLKNVPNIPSDEDEELNRKGRLLADEVFRIIQIDVQRNSTGPQTFKPYKFCITPVSAIESKKVADCIKEIEKEKSKDKQNELFNKKNSIQKNQIKAVTRSLKCFLCKLKEASHHRLLKNIFLGWMQVHLSEENSHTIQRRKEIKSKEQAKYIELKKELQENSIELRDQKQKMVQAIEQLENSMFGVDHLFREISHIYNTIFELNISNLPTDLLSKDDVTAIFADFIIEGESFEVIDGDSMFMAKYWMKYVTKAADKKMNNAKVASLSVLGLQSSGKSTMLNTMFGVHFSVSTGRCTKGINAQLLPVGGNGKNNCPFKYVMVVDSEGLRAPELDDLAMKADRDNALATFVTGLGDLTLMNIMGENFADMRDILQIIVHALLRLKLANKAIRTGQACVFVHHNVTEKSARDNMKDGFLKLVNILDSVTQEAAKAEGISDITRFSEVIKFDVEENVFNVPNLWQGIVPMNRVNTDYSDGVLSIKSSLMKIISGVSGKSFTKLSDFIVNAEDLWKGILVENFVFSFRNSLEIKAYCSLEEQIQKVIWENEMNEKEKIFNNMQKKFATCTKRITLEEEKVKLFTGFRQSIVEMKRQVVDKVIELFEKNDHPDIVIKWKGAALININHRCEQLEVSIRNEINNAYQRCVVSIETASFSREKTEKLREESMILAKRLQGQELDNNTIKMHFYNMWQLSMGQLETELQSYTEKIDEIVLQILYEIHTKNDTLLTIELNRVQYTPSRHINRCEISEDDISIKKSWKFWQTTNKTETMTQVKTEIDLFISEGDSMIKRLIQTMKEISNTEIKRFVHSVWDSLTTLSAKHEAQHFTLKTTALIKAHVHVCLHAWPLFKEHNEKYDREHGTRAQLNKCKDDMFISFMDCINNRRAEETSAKFFCTGVERSFKKITQKKVCMKVEQELRGKLPNLKHVLIKDICIDLANKNNFDQFIKYLTNAEVYASLWFKTKGDELLFTTKRYSSIVENIISLMADQLEREVRSLKARLTAPVNGFDIFKAVSEQLEDKLEVMEFESFRTDDRRIEDIGYFIEILLGENGILKLGIENVRCHFNSVTAQNVTWEINPYGHLLETVWGCKGSCPFCREPCAKSSADHENVDHYCFQHRIQCCTGVHMKSTKAASLEVCNYQVQSSLLFSCSFTKGKCPLGPECSDHYLPYKEFKNYFPDWDIPPSTNEQDCSQFWLRFVNEHKRRLSAHYGIKVENIPSSWSNITKEDAIKSLDRYSTS